MKFIPVALLVVSTLYLVFVVGPSVVAFFMIFKRKFSRQIEKKNMEGTSYEPFMPEILKAISALKEKEAETVEIRSADGLLLRGKYYDIGSRKTCILFHGYRVMPPDSLSGPGVFFMEEGFNLLFIEQRGTNGSEGKYTSLGVREQLDVRSWVRFAEERGAEEILLYGASMGATTVGLACDHIRSDRVKGIIWDAGFVSPKYQIVKQATDRKTPGGLMAPVVRVLGFFILKGDLYEKVSEHMAHCRIPVFFLHSETDEVVPAEDTAEVFEACKAPKIKLITKTGGHTTAFYGEEERVKQCLHTFLEAYFDL